MSNSPENDKENMDMDSVSTEGKTGKLDPNDASLAIVKKSNFNRKTIRIAVLNCRRSHPSWRNDRAFAA